MILYNNLFSDIDFFDDCFKYMPWELDVEVFKAVLCQKKLIEYFEESKINIKSSPPEIFFDPERNMTQNFDIYFELKNKKDNGFNPIAININYTENTKSYKVYSVTYAFNEKKICMSYEDNYSYANWAFEKYIRFENEKEEKLLYFYISKDNFEFVDSKNSKQLCIDYLYPILTLQEAFDSINRVLLLKQASIEQQELDLLKYDTNLESCCFSGKLNKAEFLLYDKNATMIKQKLF